MRVESWKGQYGGPLEPGHRLVTDLKGWKSLVTQLNLNAPPPDFAKSVVVAAFVGERPTGASIRPSRSGISPRTQAR